MSRVSCEILKIVKHSNKNDFQRRNDNFLWCPAYPILPMGRKYIYVMCCLSYITHEEQIHLCDVLSILYYPWGANTFMWCPAYPILPMGSKYIYVMSCLPYITHGEQIHLFDLLPILYYPRSVTYILWRSIKKKQYNIYIYIIKRFVYYVLYYFSMKLNLFFSLCLKVILHFFSIKLKAFKLLIGFIILFRCLMTEEILDWELNLKFDNIIHDLWQITDIVYTFWFRIALKGRDFT